MGGYAVSPDTIPVIMGQTHRSVLQLIQKAVEGEEPPHLILHKTADRAEVQPVIQPTCFMALTERPIKGMMGEIHLVLIDIVVAVAEERVKKGKVRMGQILGMGVKEVTAQNQTLLVLQHFMLVAVAEGYGLGPELPEQEVWVVGVTVEKNRV
jgi:hypothetical protein